MKNIVLALTVILMGCGGDIPDSGANDVILTTDKIDSKAVIVGLPVDGHQNTDSENGKVKQVWRIVNNNVPDDLKFEVIGNNQSDADLIGWNCEQFNGDGSSVSQLQESSFCHSLFIDVLGKFVTNPELVTVTLMNKTGRSNINAVYEIGDLSFETDGRYYFIRRISRI
jgi:hypothetical protein